MRYRCAVGCLLDGILRAMKSSDLLVILGYVMLAPHASPWVGVAGGIVALVASIILRAYDR